MITATDAFCGAGGSSEGMKNAGVMVKTAINHWALAIETHNTNHPNTDHYCADMQVIHPSVYPFTDIVWMSPSCTNHSLAKGKARKGLSQLDLWGDSRVDPAEERSRATMREVVEFAAYHHNPIVIVENVVDIRYWEYYEDWIQAMVNLGYTYKTLYLNAQFFGVPQSRDRWYTVFWLKGNKAPNLDFRPAAFCPKCDRVIESVQSWKKDFQWGRYGANRQYVYRCPLCATEVKPPTMPAASVIDWSLPAPTIGEREKPLKPKTIERIEAGLRKFANQAVLVNLAYNHAKHDGQVRSLTTPMSTQTSQQTIGLAMPPYITSQHGGRQAVREVDKVMPCVTGFNNEHQLVIPPFITSPNHSDVRNVAVDEPFRTVMPQGHPSLVIPPYMVVLKNSAPDGYLMPARSLDEPLTTVVASASQHALVTPPFIVPLRKEVAAHGIDEPLFTVATGNHHALVEPEALLNDCRFRMLEPGELKLAMSFPDSYVILGNKRDQTRQVGNAVACNVAEWITRRCVESLAS